jgi:D-alanyl-D-alanine carboxypeptidase
MASAGSLAADPAQVRELVLAEMAKAHVPGCAVAVVRNGKIVLEEGYGLANLEHSVPVRSDSVFLIGSVTKTFTALMTMMLVEEGKLALDDPIRKHLDDLPEAWQSVQVRHLLNHTSGIRSYTGLAAMQRVASPVTPKAIVDLSRDLPLEFEPGKKFDYNNTGYVLLGMIIQKIEQKGYNDALRVRILEPAGLTATALGDWSAITPNRVAGYDSRNGAHSNARYIHLSWPFSAGGIASSVSDLARWDLALDAEKLLPLDALRRMWEPTQLGDGQVEDYGLGWTVSRIGEHRVVGHNGGIFGFSSAYLKFPELRLSVVVLANTDSGLPDDLALKIAQLYEPLLKKE